MNIARIVGNVTPAVTHPGLRGTRLLLCCLLDEHGRETGKIIGAIDYLGAGFGETVLVDADGDAVQLHCKDVKAPLRNIVVGLVDAIQGVAS